MTQFYNNIYGCGWCEVPLRPTDEHGRNHSGDDIIAISVWEVFGSVFFE
jgi:hypothetical protein